MGALNKNNKAIGSYSFFSHQKKAKQEVDGDEKNNVNISVLLAFLSYLSSNKTTVLSIMFIQRKY